MHWLVPLVLLLSSLPASADTPQALRDAIVAAEHEKKPIELQFRKGDEYVTIPMEYYDGLRIPSLQRVDGTPARMDDIFAPSKAELPAM